MELRQASIQCLALVLPGRCQRGRFHWVGRPLNVGLRLVLLANSGEYVSPTSKRSVEARDLLVTTLPNSREVVYVIDVP